MKRNTQLGLAKVGIIALIDEATKYQEVRPKDALSRIHASFKNERKKYFCSMGCGYPVPYADTPCGECTCEQDSE